MPLDSLWQNNDMVNQNVTDPTQGIIQRIQIRWEVLSGEWVPDSDFGISLAQVQYNTREAADIVGQTFVEQALLVPGVNSATLQKPTINNFRQFSGGVIVTTQYGNLSLVTGTNNNAG